MYYSEFAEVYEEMGKTSGRLEKTTILAGFLKKLKRGGKSEWIYLLNGRVVPDYDSRELGISRQTALKALGKSMGVSAEAIYSKLRKIGDLGEIAEEIAEKKKQSTLFSSKLKAGKVFDNLRKLLDIQGKGAVDKKMALIAELMGSAEGKEAKYIMRTLLSDLKVGVAKAVIVDAIAEAFFDGGREVKEEIERAYDLLGDFALVMEKASQGRKELETITLTPGKPSEVMLAVKVGTIKEGFEMCGKPAAFEHKYDGFRMLIHKKDKKIMLFTRRLENVTSQFPDVVEAVKKHVEGESYILDSEVVGYNPETKKYKPFEAISQRIKRKYEIERLVGELPVEVAIFDVLYLDGKSRMQEPFSERRKIVERIVETKEYVIRPAKQIITDNEKTAEKFYEEALELGEEGVMVKNLNAPYRQGRRVGYIVKIKPDVRDLDLVIVGAEYGTGKRGGWLTSYVVACKDGEGFLEVGKVSSGLKEKAEEGTTYDEMTQLLKPLITEEKGNEVKVKPKLIVAVTYQNIQKSPSYSSGYAMRFPRITAYRPDRTVRDIATLSDIEEAANG